MGVFYLQISQVQSLKHRYCCNLRIKSIKVICVYPSTSDKMFYILGCTKIMFLQFSVLKFSSAYRLMILVISKVFNSFVDGFELCKCKFW